MCCCSWLQCRPALRRLNDLLSSGASPISSCLTFSLPKQRTAEAESGGLNPGSNCFFFFKSRFLDKFVIMVPPVEHCRVHSQPVFTHNWLPGAAIHLRFVYFSGRYKMTPLPLISSLSPDAVSAVMNHFIFCSLMKRAGREQQSFSHLMHSKLLNKKKTKKTE